MAQQIGVTQSERDDRTKQARNGFFDLPLDRFLAHPFMTVVEVAIGVMLTSEFSGIALGVLTASLFPGLFLGFMFWAPRRELKIRRAGWVYLITMAIVFVPLMALVAYSGDGIVGLVGYALLGGSLALVGLVSSVILALYKAMSGFLVSAFLVHVVGFVAAEALGIVIAAAFWLLVEHRIRSDRRLVRDLTSAIG